jgi:hypothetical protein
MSGDKQYADEGNKQEYYYGGALAIGVGHTRDDRWLFNCHDFVTKDEKSNFM